MELLLAFIAFPVGIASFLIIFSWPLLGIHLGRQFAYRIWGYQMPERKAVKFGYFTMIAGAGVLWLLWRYVLPDWWIASTPLLSGAH
jgi:hypothetical protein